MNTMQPSILVVDDEQDTCSNLQDILTDLGYYVDVAYDGPSALQRLELRPYDVALLDLKMPGMDGIELYRRIKQMRADTVAIIVTAYASTETADSAKEAGALEILPKPVEFPRLLTLVDQVLDQPLLLVVDDDHDLCDSLRDLFRESDYRVCVAHSLTESQNKLENREYRVVLIDMKLSDGGGEELFQMVHQTSPATRTMLITAYRGETERVIQRIMHEGADAVCYKPFNVPELLATLHKLASEK